jgi:3-mercaptopyruvate sulfurtransferase SseA
MTIGKILLLTFLILAVLYWFIIYFVPAVKRFFYRNLPHITPQDLEKSLKDDILIIDTRGSKDFNGYFGRIPNSVNVPFASLKEKFANIDSELLDTHIVLYDIGDGEAYSAYKILKKLGLKKISILNGGYRVWLKEGRKVERNDKSIEID